MALVCVCVCGVFFGKHVIYILDMVDLVEFRLLNCLRFYFFWWYRRCLHTLARSTKRSREKGEEQHSTPFSYCCFGHRSECTASRKALPKSWMVSMIRWLTSSMSAVDKKTHFCLMLKNRETGHGDGAWCWKSATWIKYLLLIRSMLNFTEFCVREIGKERC